MASDAIPSNLLPASSAVPTTFPIPGMNLAILAPTDDAVDRTSSPNLATFAPVVFTQLPTLLTADMKLLAWAAEKNEWNVPVLTPLATFWATVRKRFGSIYKVYDGMHIRTIFYATCNLLGNCGQHFMLGKQNEKCICIPFLTPVATFWATAYNISSLIRKAKTVDTYHP
jgi:hypothetical protein